MTTSAAGLRLARLRLPGRLPGRPLPRPVQLLLLIVAVVVAYALPIVNPPFLTTTGSAFGGVLFTAASYALIAVGLNIVVGYAGLLDLGYVGFYACGAYTVAVLTRYHGSWPFYLVLPAAIVVTMVSGVILGAPTLRVRGDYLAIVTLGFGEIIRLVVTNTNWLGGAGGIPGIPPPGSIGGAPDPTRNVAGGLFSIPHIAWIHGQPLIDTANQTRFLAFGVLDPIPYYWLILTALLIVLVGDILIKKSRVGRAWEATREDEEAAETMGVPTFRFKLLAFALGAAIGGLSGAFYAGEQSFVAPMTFVVTLSELFVAAVIIGGAGNRWGALAGGVLVAYLPERFRSFSDWRILVFGLALLALAIWRPQGLFPARRGRRPLTAAGPQAGTAGRPEEEAAASA